MSISQMCVICKSTTAEYHEDEMMILTSASGMLATYRQRLEAALGVQLESGDIEDACLCRMCEERLVQIEQLSKVRESFRRDFMKRGGGTSVESREGATSPSHLPGSKGDAPTPATPLLTLSTGSGTEVEGTKNCPLLSEPGDTFKEKSSVLSRVEDAISTNTVEEDGSAKRHKMKGTRSVLAKQLQTVSKGPWQTCQICGSRWRGKRLLEQHMRSQHAAMELHRCCLCWMNIEGGLAGVRKHFQASHPRKAISVEKLSVTSPNNAHTKDQRTRKGCKNERKIIVTRAQQKRKLNDLKCLKCTATFSELANLQQHMITHRRSTQSLESTGVPDERCTLKAKESPAPTLVPRRRKDEPHRKVFTPDNEQGFFTSSTDEDIHIATVTEATLMKKETGLENVPYQMDQGDSNGQGDSLEIIEDFDGTESNEFAGGYDDISEGTGPERNKTWSCSVCKKFFRSQNSLQLHERTAHRGKVKSRKMHPCPHCARTFSHEVDLTDHITAHEEGKVLLCSVCSMGYCQKSSLDDHMRQHTGNYPHHCEVCNKGFSHVWALKNHAVAHTKEKPYECKYCSAKFKNLDQRRFHSLQEHPEHMQHRKHECSHCRQRFHTLRTLDVHLRKTHKGDLASGWRCAVCDTNISHWEEYKKHWQENHAEQERQFSCKTCGKTFQRKNNFEAHLETHLETKTAQCKLCGKMFKGKSQLASHMHWHLLKDKRPKDQSYLCEECGKSYKNLKGLNDHIRCHRGVGTYTCHICQLVVPNQSRLKKHLSSVHPSERPFKCDICDKTFVYEISFKSHQNMHQDIRPFLCSECGKGFRTRPHLKEHMNMHSQTKSFMCSVCSASFLWRAQLIRHKRDKHPDPNAPVQVPVKRDRRKRPIQKDSEENITTFTPAENTGHTGTSYNQILNASGTGPVAHNITENQPHVASQQPCRQENTQNQLVESASPAMTSNSSQQLQANTVLQHPFIEGVPIQAIIDQAQSPGKTTFVLHSSNNFSFMTAEMVPQQHAPDLATTQNTAKGESENVIKSQGIIEGMSSSELTVIEPATSLVTSMSAPQSLSQLFASSNGTYTLASSFPMTTATVSKPSYSAGDLLGTGTSSIVEIGSVGGQNIPTGIPQYITNVSQNVGSQVTHSSNMESIEQSRSSEQTSVISQVSSDVPPREDNVYSEAGIAVEQLNIQYAGIE